MKETKFKVLMYCNNYVDMDLLSNGIYITSKPNLHSKDATIEGMVFYCKNINFDMNGNSFISDEYIKNLEQCQFVDFNLIEDNSN